MRRQLLSSSLFRAIMRRQLLSLSLLRAITSFGNSFLFLMLNFCWLSTWLNSACAPARLSFERRCKSTVVAKNGIGICPLSWRIRGGFIPYSCGISAGYSNTNIYRKIINEQLSCITILQKKFQNWLTTSSFC